MKQEKSVGDNVTTCNNSHSINLDSLYCSHLWTNSKLRNAIISAPLQNNEYVKYCYTCRGKIRKYEVKSYEKCFTPNEHSTPHRNTTTNSNEFEAICSSSSITQDAKQYIPTISHQIDLENRQKFTSHNSLANEPTHKNLRKDIGCVFNFSFVDSPKKKRKKIQACSISVMILAILVISFVLVNFTTPHFTQPIKNYTSTIEVPIENLDYNETPSPKSNILVSTKTESLHITTTELFYEIVTKRNASSIISKIRKNIKTYPRYSDKSREEIKEINNRDVSQQFCSCQKNDICMLDENSGKAICRPPVDANDPTGCGGLCALETEACHLVDKERGVRVCRTLTSFTCSPDKWKCRNGLCVSANARCDGTIQCSDRSDEILCDCDLRKEFRCGHLISCFPYTKLCDGVVDCWDASDEVNCTTDCRNDQFMCKNGACILFSRFCDGLTDCSDGSDEPQGCGTCGEHELRCENQRCVPKTVRCDGHDNCGDSTDELNCPHNT